MLKNMTTHAIIELFYFLTNSINGITFLVVYGHFSSQFLLQLEGGRYKQFKVLEIYFLECACPFWVSVAKNVISTLI
jgi:hypothetical protein